MLDAVFAAVLVIVLRSRRKTWKDGAIPVPYQSELELQGDVDPDDGEFGQYRDEPVGDEHDGEFDDASIE